MTRLAALAIACLAAATSCRSGAATETAGTPDPIAPYAGRWIQRGPYDIIGAGTDEVLTIARDEHGWTLAITLVLHPSVNEASRALTRVEYAPTPLVWRAGCLEYPNPRQPACRERLTVDMVGERMMLPAIVRRDERTWEFQGRHDHDTFQCDHDPFVVPEGGAVTNRIGYPKQPCYYRMTETRSLEQQGTHVPCLQFFQIAPDGSEHMCVQLVFERGQYGTLLRLGTTYSGYAGDPWMRCPDEEWRAVQAVPLGGDAGPPHPGV
jgi:hypothetical protein